ncbi:hypothetical protein Tsubulata_038866 [Turnera subulata]|uniref:Ribosome-inactivating protein n=1 Tax=Turnera subulata TaxID=218843 RepID=A0A9Q0FAS9_9ROSI|nr:hypothetical protein Tsubulata_038866 [Turnera subulata]
MEGSRRSSAVIWLAAWLCFFAFFDRAWGNPLVIQNEYALGLLEGKETALEFTTYGVTKKSYMKFVTSLRNQLASDYKRHGIPVLPQPSRVADGERFLLVKLSNSPEVCISLALDVTDANVVGYQAGVESYFFSDAPNLAFSNLFAKTQKKKLPFGITYPELEKAAGANRHGIDLGISNLDGAITTLYQSNGSPVNSVASALILVMQMITEAARFRCMELQVRFNINRWPDKYPSFRPDPSIIELENKWISLSTEIQQSYQRAFFNAVPLRRANGEIYYAYSVSDILRANLALLKFVCTSTEPTSASSSSPSYLHQVISDYDVPCPALEPTLKIMGRDALCVAAHNYAATDGNPVILFDCGVNHFWTFQRDGTIRYKDQCLTTYNFGPESNMVIYNCSTAPKSTTIWVMDTNGSIVNPYSGWSLTSVLPTKATKLTIEKTSLVSSQGWYPTNNTQILYASIVGLEELCLKVRPDNNLWLDNCANLTLGREWAIYADGTIRPTSAPQRCLTCNSPFLGSPVIVMDCNPSGWSSQRWAFNNDGSIMNPRSGLVLDVKGSDVSLQQLIIWLPNGNPNQKWLPLL